MNIKLLILLTCVFLNTLLFSQSQPKAFEDWKTTTGSQNFFYKNITKTDGLGNVYVAGATLNGAGNTDILLAKYNSAGVQLWIRQYAGSANGTDFAADLTVTNTDAYLTGAVTNNTTTMLPDMITMKYKHDGTFQWATTYNGSANSLDVSKSIIRDAANGNIYVTGTSYNANYNADVAVIKYNASGVQQWANTYNHSTNLDDAGFKVVLKGTTAITVSGAVTIGTNQYKYGTFVCSQTNGSITATTIGTFVTTSSITAVSDFVTDASGNSIIVGSMYVAGQGDNMYVQKLGTTLVPAWTYTYNNASNLDDVAKVVQIDASGNVYITGYSAHATEGRNITTIKLNSSGVQQWLQTTNSSSNGNDEAADMAIDASSNIYIAGYIQSDINQADYYTAKYNSAGTKLWEVQTDGLHLNDQITNIALDSLNNVIVTGQSEVTTGNFEFLTTKYVQKNVTTPTDFNGELPASNFRYYENKGQLISTTLTAVPEVRFYTNNTSPSHYIKNNSSSFVFSRVDTIRSSLDTLQQIDMTYDLASSVTKTYALEQQQDFYLNYFLPQTVATNGISGVFGNQRLITQNIYPNIDLMYSSNQNGIKYYYIVKQGGDPRNILMTFDGATSYSLNGTTNELLINSSIGSLTFNRPVAYQLSATNSPIAITTWTPSWQTNGANNKYKFNTGAYTTSLTLVIEVSQKNISASPTNAYYGNLNYSTYYGGSNADEFKDITIKRGARFITGRTSGIMFPKFNGIFSYNGSSDAVLLKYLMSSDSLKFATFYGGADFDDATCVVATTPTGDVYISGKTFSIDLPQKLKSGATNRLSNGFDGSITGSALEDGFIAQFSNNGLSYKWGTYIGGYYRDAVNYMTLDSANNLYVCGRTASDNFPVTAGAYKTSMSSGQGVNGDMFVMKYNANSLLQWSTFYGGTNLTSTTTVTYARGDVANSITVDKLGNVYVVGNTEATNYPIIFPGTPTANSVNYSSFNGGRADGAIVKFNNTGTPIWSSYFGGEDIDDIYDVKIAKNNDIILFGSTKSMDTIAFPIKRKAGAFNYVKKYNFEKAFLSKISSTYDNTWTTFYSQHAYSQMKPARIAIVNDGFVAAGSTSSDSIHVPSILPSGVYTKSHKSSATHMSFLTYFDSNQSLYHAHYFGNDYSDNILYGLAYDQVNSIYFVGHAWSIYPIAYTALNAALIDSTFGGIYDGFITRLAMPPIPVSIQTIQQAQTNGINVYPNPVLNEFYINANDLKNSKNYTITVHNSQGQVIAEFTNKNFNSDLLRISCQHWSAGLYLVSIKTEQQHFVSKVMKE